MLLFNELLHHLDSLLVLEHGVLFLHLQGPLNGLSSLLDIVLGDLLDDGPHKIVHLLHEFHLDVLGHRDVLFLLAQETKLLQDGLYLLRVHLSHNCPFASFFLHALSLFWRS